MPAPTLVPPPEDPSVRDLPTQDGPRLKTLLRRAVKRQCPQCGSSDIFKNYLTIKDHCPRCSYRFEREEGYFLGSYAINLIAAEFITIGLLVIFLTQTDYSWVVLELIFIPMAVILPFITFPFSRTFWMALDLMLDRNESDLQLRHDQMFRKPPA
jgi:uncharacterized protein (DUF983 family)